MSKGKSGDGRLAVIDPDRALTLGWPEPYGAIGVHRRIARMNELVPLQGNRLLDVGCGNGSYTTVMAEGFDEVYGIEVEPVRLEDFASHLPLGTESKFHLAQMTAETMDFPAGFFDVVTAIETIEHIEDLDRAVAEVFRVLRPGGVFVITAPNRWFPVETHSFKIRGKEYRSKRWPLVPWIKPLHRRISTARNFRSSDLKRLLEPLGFECVGINYVMPQFERRSSLGFLRTLTDRLEPTALGTFGVSIVAAYRKPG